jgi:hypothetical protein
VDDTRWYRIQVWLCYNYTATSMEHQIYCFVASLQVEENDLIIVPAGIFHRFTLDSKNAVKAMRLFKVRIGVLCGCW